MRDGEAAARDEDDEVLRGRDGAATAGIAPSRAASRTQAGHCRAPMRRWWSQVFRQTSAGRRPSRQRRRLTSALSNPSPASSFATKGARAAAATPPCSIVKPDAAEPMTLARSSSPPVTLMTLSARMATTTLSVASKPSSSWSGGHGERSVRSARRRVYRPGWPRPANDTAPGQPPPTLFMTRRTARPMAAFACQPGPSAPKPAFMPAALATGPQTTRSGATFSSVVWTPRRLKAGSAIARSLERLGVEVRVRTVDAAQYRSRRNVRDFDMLIHTGGVVVARQRAGVLLGDGGGGAGGRPQLPGGAGPDHR